MGDEPLPGVRYAGPASPKRRSVATSALPEVPVAMPDLPALIETAVLCGFGMTSSGRAGLIESDVVVGPSPMKRFEASR